MVCVRVCAWQRGAGGEYEEEHVLAASGKKITVTYNDYVGICTFD